MTARHLETVLTKSGLTGSDRLTMAVIAYLADFDGWASASLRDLARLTGLSKSAIDKHVAKAIEAGELAIAATGKGRAPRAYVVTLGEPEAVRLTPEAPPPEAPPPPRRQPSAPPAFAPEISPNRRPVGPEISMNQSPVAAIVAAAGLTPPPGAPFYWSRADHAPDADALIQRLGSLDAVLDHVRRHPPKAAVRRLTQLVEVRR